MLLAVDTSISCIHSLLESGGTQSPNTSRFEPMSIQSVWAMSNLGLDDRLRKTACCWK